MGLFRSIWLQFCPLKMDDADFGKLLYIYISNDPKQSYWEGQWQFPPTGTVISISLPGDESGPYDEARKFYLEMIPKYENLIELARPQLIAVFKQWFKKELPKNIFTDLKLSGCNLIEARVRPVCWELSFETTGNRWLGITIPFEDESAKEAIVDT